MVNQTDADNKMLRNRYPMVWAEVKRTKSRITINAEPRPDVVTRRLAAEVGGRKGADLKVAS